MRASSWTRTRSAAFGGQVLGRQGARSKKHSSRCCDCMGVAGASPIQSTTHAVVDLRVSAIGIYLWRQGHGFAIQGVWNAIVAVAGKRHGDDAEAIHGNVLYVLGSG